MASALHRYDALSGLIKSRKSIAAPLALRIKQAPELANDAVAESPTDEMQMWLQTQVNPLHRR
ncbi:hypothetical protein CXB77_12720 [Chromatium okenii]|uniref:Uncharacterized protein n=1 Tax=Chromatium okenii TaxID=61644 RepID=A0A2S7XN45_9GAMM|nr:hypothetical protein CXB77_12720 [Chromatium okenii]